MTNAIGVLRVVREITVQPGTDNEFIAISDKPAAVGERLQLERMVNGSIVSVPVGVIDSRPAVVAGAVRHRLQLRLLDDIAPLDERIRR